MKAAEARALAQQRANELCTEYKAIYDRVINQIKGILEKSECYSTEWYSDLPSPVIKMLENDGYKVTWSSHRNETQYNICWSGDLEV